MADDRPVAGLLVAVGLLLLVTAGVMLTGVVGLFRTGGTDVATDSPAVPTPSDAATEATPASGSQPFTLETRDIETCGMLCRNVTSTVTNEQSAPARDSSITTRLYAGNDTRGEVRWQATERVGTIGAGETYRTTQRVELPLEDALAIRDAGGWVTIRSTVETASQSVTITERRDVS
ncbi:hypothetical protein BRC96_10640 [Halobacteriales archaeon QS_6_64_34]|nr:MAG: hypothetical protein BRC96_10640 [Halobacteriales archaeon QS_6_64_34]